MKPGGAMFLYPPESSELAHARALLDHSLERFEVAWVCKPGILDRPVIVLTLSVVLGFFKLGDYKHPTRLSSTARDKKLDYTHTSVRRSAQRASVKEK